MPDVVRKLDLLVNVLLEFRVKFGTEAAMHEAIESILDYCQVPYVREHMFDKLNRIDFFLHEYGIGIECKVDGGPSSVLSQLIRYADLPEVKAIVLVTSRHTHNFNETTLRDKPFRVVWVGGGGL